MALGRFPRSRADYEQLIASNIEELERLSRMIESMLSLARSGQDEVLLARQRPPALDELENLANFFEGMAEERRVRLDSVASGEVLADSSLLRRALANLVSNAMRHADEDSVITLRASQNGGSTELSVENSGMPVAHEHLAHLFERFYRAATARSHVDGSTGLGLAIVRAIMDLHGGSADVQTDGACIKFTLIFPGA